MVSDCQADLRCTCGRVFERQTAGCASRPPETEHVRHPAQRAQTVTDEKGSKSVPQRRQIPAAVLAFGVVSLLTDVSSESVAAVLPLYITAVLGMGPLAYGFIDGIYQGVSAAVRILGGWWSDSTKRPKWVAFVGYLASALSRIGLLLATGFASITAVISVDRLGKGLRTGPRDSLIATASDPGDLGRNFGVHRAMDTAGALAGPLLAFAVLAAIPLGLGGYHAVFVFSLAFAVLGVMVLALVVPDLRTADGQAALRRPERATTMALRLSDLSQPALRRRARGRRPARPGHGWRRFHLLEPLRGRIPGDEVFSAALCRYECRVHGARNSTRSSR